LGSPDLHLGKILDEEFLLWHIPSSLDVPIPSAICKLFGLFFRAEHQNWRFGNVIEYL